MDDIGSVIAGVNAAIEELGQTCSNLRAGAERTDQAAHDALRNAKQTTALVEEGLASVRTDMAGLDGELSTCAHDSERLGKRLEPLFGELYQLLQALQSVEETGKTVKEKLNAAWESNQAIGHVLNVELGTWTRVHDEMHEQGPKLEGLMHRMAVRFGDLELAQQATYAILEDMIQAGFSLVSHQYRETQLEAMLAASHERLVRVRLEAGREFEALKQLVLHIDVTGLAECTKAAVLEQVRETIRDVRTRLDGPERARRDREHGRQGRSREANV